MKALRPEYSTEQLEVSGCNVLHKLTHGEQFRSFENKTPSEIIKGVIDMYSLKAEVDDFGVTKEFTTEDGYNDYQYLMRTAGMYGWGSCRKTPFCLVRRQGGQRGIIN